MTRRRAKAINFGIIYGISGFGLARQLGITPGEARTYIDAYFVRYPGIRIFMERTKEEARINGYVTTPFGRRCWVPGIADKNHARRAYAERQAINAPLQGGGADIIKRAMVRLPRCVAGSRAEVASAAAGARRTAVRGAGGRGAGAHRACTSGDGECGDAVGAAGGGDRHRSHLGGCTLTGGDRRVRPAFPCHCESTPAVGRPALDETVPSVMAGLVPAIRSGRVPRLMAGTSPAMTVKMTPNANRVSG